MEKLNVQKFKASELELKEKVVNIRRVTKVTKGGRTFTFSATVVVGNGNGIVGDRPNEINDTLAPSGSRLPVTAKFKGNVVARYEFPISDWNGHFQVAANHTGGRRSDLRPFQAGIKGGLDAYTTVDLSFGVKNDLWSIEAFATNVLDEIGVINTGVSCVETICGDPGGGTALGGTFYDTLIKPRVIGLKFSRDF